jgi:hypothetical protein
MQNLIWEENVFGTDPNPKYLARHLFTRMSCGQAVIVAANPAQLLEPLRKQWVKLTRKVQAERDDIDNIACLLELTTMIIRMQSLKFTANWPDENPAHVYLASLEQVLSWAPECRTLYVTCEATLEQLHIMSALMPNGGVLVKVVGKSF